MKHVIALLMAAGFIVAIGCAADSLEATSVRLDGCTVAEQCGGNFLCIDNRCVDARQAIGPDEVSIEVAPPPGSPYTRHHRLDVSLENAARRIMLRVPVPIAYEAVVLDGNGDRVAAELTVFGSNRIPGREIVQRANVSATSEQGAMFSLVEGTYSARIRPLDPNLAPLEVESFTVRVGAVLPKQFRLPADFRHLSGRIFIAQASDDPIEGASVRAVGEKSGLESTVAISDVDGRYDLRLPETDDTVFRVTATVRDEDQPAWGYEDSILVERSEDRRLDIAIDRSSNENRGTVSMSVIGLYDDGTGAAIKNARVTLTASVANRLTPPVYATTGLTDSRGQVLVTYQDALVDAIPLLRARYIIDIVPLATSEFGRASTVLDLRGAGQDFTLDRQVQAPPRTNLIGDVASNFARAVRARIELYPLAAGEPRRDTETDASGRFSLPIDAGDYVLVARPLESVTPEGYVPVGVQRITVPGMPTHVLPPFRLPAGNLVTGTVQGAIQDEPVFDADVEMFVREQGLTISLGRTVTDDIGYFEIVLPVP